jgi:hypothetical protein
MSYRSSPRAIHATILALVVILAVFGGVFYYASSMDPAYVPEGALPAGWYLDNVEHQSARFGLDQQSRYTYIRSAGPPAALSIFTFHNVLPQSNNEIVSATMNTLMLSLVEEQDLSVIENTSGTRADRNSFYREIKGERSLGRFNKEYLNVYGEFWKDGYGTYVMCIGFAKTGDKSFVSSNLNTESYDQIRGVLIPAVTQ